MPRNRKQTNMHPETIPISAILFQVYPHILHPFFCSTYLPIYIHLLINRGVQIMVDVKQLTFYLGDIEPFFCSSAAYDVAKKKKISENFYFDLNNDEQTKLIEEHMVRYYYLSMIYVFYLYGYLCLSISI